MDRHLNTIEGKRIRLKYLPETNNYHRLLVEWRNENKKWFYSEDTICLEQHKKWYKSMIRDESMYFYVIFAKDTDRPIGTIGFFNYNEYNKSAEYAWLLIGDEDYKSKGYGIEAEHLILDYVFNQLELNRFDAEILAYNDLVINLHKKTGFKIEGIRRKCIFKKSKYHDVVCMGLLWEEYQEKLWD